MEDKTQKPDHVDCSSIDCSKARRLTFTSPTAKPDFEIDDAWIYDPSGKTKTYHPADRCGGPFGISDIVNADDSYSDEWFCFAVVDCFFPVYDVVRASSFEEAFELYIDFAAEHRGIKIEEPDLKDYIDEEHPENGPECSYTSNGEPVEIDNIHGSEMKLRRIEL